MLPLAAHEDGAGSGRPAVRNRRLRKGKGTLRAQASRPQTTSPPCDRKIAQGASRCQARQAASASPEGASASQYGA